MHTYPTFASVLYIETIVYLYIQIQFKEVVGAKNAELQAQLEQQQVHHVSQLPFVQLFLCVVFIFRSLSCTRMKSKPS